MALAGTPLKHLGSNGCTVSAPCDACEGDCDTDADCKTGHCFLREDTASSGMNNKRQVPGCDMGGSGDIGGVDYCYEPPNSTDWSSSRRSGSQLVSPAYWNMTTLSLTRVQWRMALIDTTESCWCRIT